LSKDEIMAAVWPDTTVEEANLTVQISSLRRILDAERRDGSCIQTLSGRGYRFICPVARVPDERLKLIGDEQPRPRLSRSLVRTVAVGAVLLVACPFAGGWMLRRDAAPSISAGGTESPRHDRRQSAIVLPFENSSGDPAQDGLAAALTRDLTDRISLGGDGPVVPGMTASAYRGRAADLQAIGTHFDVHFALLGNVGRQAGQRAAIFELLPTVLRHLRAPSGCRTARVWRALTFLPPRHTAGI
jgi:TolB-like protein